MDEFSRKLDDTLLTAYRYTVKIENQFLQRIGELNVTGSEMHLLEVIGKSAGKRCTVKQIAQALNITQPSVSAAVNRLVAKGCVLRQRSEQDGRVVYIHMTRQGRKAYALFAYFHENMVRAITRELSPEERIQLLSGMEKLNKFFEQQYRDHIAPIERRYIKNNDRHKEPYP